MGNFTIGEAAGRRGFTASAPLFTAELAGSAAQLAGPAVDGPCDETCPCVTAPPPAAAPTPVEVVAEVAAPPIACTLDAGSVPDRLDEWRGVLGHATSRLTTVDGALRIEFDDELALEELARLVAAEQRCCAFFAFALTVDHRGVALEVRAPGAAGGVVTSLFGASA